MIHDWSEGIIHAERLLRDAQHLLATGNTTAGGMALRDAIDALIQAYDAATGGAFLPYPND
jgi:hypothetical protein